MTYACGGECKILGRERSKLAAQSPLYSALYFLRANKEANVAVQASYVGRVMIAKKPESHFLKARDARRLQMLSAQKRVNAALSAIQANES